MATNSPADEAKAVNSNEKPEIHSDSIAGSGMDEPAAPPKKRTFKQKFMGALKEPGSALQIVIAAILGIVIGISVTTTVEEVPDAAVAILGIPGVLWLRALKACVLPLIITAMILAVQQLREMATQGAGAGVLARWAIGYYVLTTLLAVIISVIMVSQVWAGLMTVANEEALQVSESDAKAFKDKKFGEQKIHDVVVQMFESLIPANIIKELANDGLLAILITSITVGYLIKGPDSSLLRAVKEVEKITTRVITFLIKCAPIGVFFLIMTNLWRLDIADIGLNLGILIGGTISTMAIHLFVFIPTIYFAVVRKNPYSYWLSNSPAWLTAWGSASSAATLPVTLKCARARGIPITIGKFMLPLGATINMDGTAIYFPACVVFLAATQGITLNAAQYVIICLLATLASVGTTPIPSSSLVLTVMIAGSVDVPITGMYAVVVAIDWFLDRFRTALNVSGDLFAAAVVYKVTKIEDPDDMSADDLSVQKENDERV